MFSGLDAFEVGVERESRRVRHDVVERTPVLADVSGGHAADDEQVAASHRFAVFEPSQLRGADRLDAERYRLAFLDAQPRRWLQHKAALDVLSSRHESLAGGASIERRPNAPEHLKGSRSFDGLVRRQDAILGGPIITSSAVARSLGNPFRC